jgi:hypothetical protein
LSASIFVRRPRLLLQRRRQLDAPQAFAEVIERELAVLPKAAKDLGLQLD